MIEKVVLRRFKKFHEQEFRLSDHVVLAGPNNSGKTTLLQAIATWDLAIRKWSEARSGKKGTSRTGVPVPRKDFTALPLRDVRLLWTDTSVALGKSEAPDGKAGHPRFIEIEVTWRDGRDTGTLTMSLRSQGSEIVYVKPLEENPPAALTGGLNVVHVPPFSGIGVEETRWDRPYQDMLIGQGKAGDILRNLLLEIHQREDGEWESLCEDVKEIFGYTLLAPDYEGRPFIVCDFIADVPESGSSTGSARLDIASAGSGFHQVLMLLAFLRARPSTVYLLDEPDAHLHVILQKQIHDRLRMIASHRNSQLIISTHSEVLIDGTDPGSIISFYEQPHRLLAEEERSRIREAIKRVTATEALLSESSSAILYVEGQSDFDILLAFARILDHPVLEWFSRRPFYHLNRGRNPREARAHFFALGASRPDMRGMLLLDGDNRGLKDHEVAADGLTIERWHRYEIESYLVHPEAMDRFARKHSPMFARMAMEYLESQLPPAIMRDPLGPHEYLQATPASKTLLPGFMQKCQLRYHKHDYHLVAAEMQPDEIHPEIGEKLDTLQAILE